jgi:hypothetical protein
MCVHEQTWLFPLVIVSCQLLTTCCYLMVMMFDSSSMVAPKLKEMDDVIRRIYDKLIRTSSDRRTLLVFNTFSLSKL